MLYFPKLNSISYFQKKINVILDRGYNKVWEINKIIEGIQYENKFRT